MSMGVFWGRHRSWMLALQISSNVFNRCRWAFFSLSQKCINDGADTLNYKQHKPSDPKQHLRRCHRCYSVTIHHADNETTYWTYLDHILTAFWQGYWLLIKNGSLIQRPHTDRILTGILTAVKNGSLVLRLHTDRVLTGILTVVKNGSLILRPHTDRILTGYWPDTDRDTDRCEKW